jgi:putative ABC transport system permease protein
MKLEATLAWRNIWRSKKRTLITVSSILFAVLFSMFGASMNRGTHDQMIRAMTEYHTGFIRVQDPAFEQEPSLDNAIYMENDFAGEIERMHQAIDFVMPRIETFILASSDLQTRAVMLMGVDFELEERLNGLASRLQEGVLPDGTDRTDSGLVLGSRLASRMQVMVGDSLILLGQGRFGMTAAAIYPVVGILLHPVSEMDNQIVYLHISEAQYLLSSEDHVTSLLVTPTRLHDVDMVAAELNLHLQKDHLIALTWAELMPELLQAVAFDMAGFYLFSGILYVVIGFGLFGTILMMTLERRREMGVLLAVGMKRTLLARVMLLETFFIGLIGVTAGLILGGFVLTYFYHNPIPLADGMADMIEDIGYEPVILFSLNPSLFWSQAVIILTMSMAVSLYPVTKILKMDVLSASRGI